MEFLLVCILKGAAAGSLMHQNFASQAKCRHPSQRIIWRIAIHDFLVVSTDLSTNVATSTYSRCHTGNENSAEVFHFNVLHLRGINS